MADGRAALTQRVVIRHAHVFCGAGGGAVGFQRGTARVGALQAHMECVGGIDNDPLALRCFEGLVGVPGTCLDLFSRDQYTRFWGKAPPAGWREVTPQDFRQAFSAHPDIVFMSSPCKGYSGLLSPSKAASDKYTALNELALRGVWLTLEALGDDPPALLLFENVPRIAQRGRRLLNQIKQLLQRYGYASAETVHDCGEIAGLAQTRKRFLLVARHRAKVPPYLYEPVKRSLRAIGDVLGAMPMPEEAIAGPMHALPSLKWETWVRLALIPAGGDWRALQNVPFQDLGIQPVARNWNDGVMGVRSWVEPSGTVCGASGPTNGAFAVADPRMQLGDYQAYMVRGWGDTCGVIGAKAACGTGGFSVADPRPVPMLYRLVWLKPAGEASDGVLPIPGQRCPKEGNAPYQTCGSYGVQDWSDTSRAVVGAAAVDNGPFSVADPRLPWAPGAHRNKLAVVPWDRRSGTVTGSLQVASGAPSVADPRATRGGSSAPVIIALDGTWHRPLTTLELAALQSFPVEQGAPWLADQTKAHGRAREIIGNAVPPDTAAAIASCFADVLLRARAGETFALSMLPVWVQPVAIALSVDTGRQDCNG